MKDIKKRHATELISDGSTSQVLRFGPVTWILDDAHTAERVLERYSSQCFNDNVCRKRVGSWSLSNMK